MVKRKGKMSQTCCLIHQLFNNGASLRFPFDERCLPKNGIYVLFEKGELSHNTNRIVRIGTHTGVNQLRSRLKQHFIKENKDRSVFRKNIGRALLNRNKDPFLKQWELDLTPRKSKEEHSGKIDFEKQGFIEKKVSDYIRNNFSFIVFEVDDKEKRLDLESKIISTISLCDECKPSVNWLGLSSPKEKIRQSGLWQVNELYKMPLSSKDMDELKQLLKISV